MDFVPNNHIITPSPTSIHNNEELNDTLKNLFQVPTQGIQNAFSIILQLIQQQQNEHKQQLQNVHYEVDRKHKDFIQDIKQQHQNEREYLLEQSNQRYETQTTQHKEYEHQQQLITQTLRHELDLMKQSLEDWKKEKHDLSILTEQIQNRQQTVEQVLWDVKEELKTMAFNLQLEDTTDTNNEDDNEPIDMEDQAEDEGNYKNMFFYEENKNKVEKANKSDVDDYQRRDSNEQNDNQQNDVINDTSDRLINSMELGVEGINDHKESPADKPLSPTATTTHPPISPSSTTTTNVTAAQTSPPSNTPSTISPPSSPTRPTLTKHTSSRTLVTTHKLQLHQTLSARLDKIEGDKEVLKQELTILKRKLDNTVLLQNGLSQSFTPITTKTSISSLQDSTLEEVHERLMTLEKFLVGFGVTNFDSMENNSTMSLHDDEEKKDISILTKISLKRECPSNDDNHGNTITNDKRDMFVGSESGLEDFSKVSSNKNISATVRKSISEVNIICSIKDAKVDKEENNSNSESMITLSNHSSNHDIENNQDKSTHMNQAKDVEAVCGVTSGNAIVEPLQRTSFNKQKSFDKSRGLLMYLMDQEKCFQSNLNSMLTRIFKLEDDIRSNSNKGIVLENKAAQEANEEKKDVESTINHQLSLSNDDSVYKTQIDDIRKALDLLRNDMNSKLSRKSMMNQLQNSNIDKNVDSSLLQHLHEMVESEIDILREQKVDKDSFEKEMEKSKSIFANTLSESLSSHEKKIMTSVTNVKNDVSSCKETLQLLENMVDSKMIDNEDLDLDEKIKRATMAMESSLQEAISSRLSCLKAMEDEMEKVALGLAEKPDQKQINEMIKNLESAVSQRLGSDETFQSMFTRIKNELNKRMTRNEVLFLVKQLLNGAKEDVQRARDNSLMIGHQPYKCLGCNELYHEGVNSSLARRVNHNALPFGRRPAPSIYPHCKPVGNVKMSKVPLKPLQKCPRPASDEVVKRSSLSWMNSNRKKINRQSR